MDRDRSSASCPGVVQRSEPDQFDSQVGAPGIEPRLLVGLCALAVDAGPNEKEVSLLGSCGEKEKGDHQEGNAAGRDQQVQDNVANVLECETCHG